MAGLWSLALQASCHQEWDAEANLLSPHKKPAPYGHVSVANCTSRAARIGDTDPGVSVPPNGVDVTESKGIPPQAVPHIPERGFLSLRKPSRLVEDLVRKRLMMDSR